MSLRALSGLRSSRVRLQMASVVRAPLPLSTPPRPERMERAARPPTTVDRTPRVQDAELAAAYSALFDVAGSAATSGGMRLVPLSAEGVPIEVQVVPRRAAPAGVHGAAFNGATFHCPFCQPDPNERALAWRGYVVTPNAFPYAPPQSEHGLVLPSSHVPQGFSSPMLKDLIDLHRRMPDRMLSFNGTAGNSQPHMHWHVTRELLPLERGLDDGTATRKRLRASHGGEISQYEMGPFRGLLVEGPPAYVVRWAQRISAVLDADPSIAGRSNLLLLRERDGLVRLVIIPRRDGPATVDIAGFGPVKLAAFECAGRAISSKEELPPDFAEAFAAAAHATIVDPEDIAGLPQMLALPETSLIEVRCRN